MTTPGVDTPPSQHYERRAHTYLRRVDRLLPGRVIGFHIVGSAALGEYRRGRSDVDFVAVLDRRLNPSEIVRLRGVHALSGAASAISALRGGRSPLTGTCNGVFVTEEDLYKPVTQIVPVASHTAQIFNVGAGFDVNPVMWKILAERGVCLRGDAIGEGDLDIEPDLLRSWNLDNLNTYWLPWAVQLLRSPPPDVWLRARWWTTWGVLGAPRLHYTVATGEIASKESAGAYALTAFEPKWHPIIEDGIAYREGRPLDRSLGGATPRLRSAAKFVIEVVEAARRL